MRHLNNSRFGVHSREVEEEGGHGEEQRPRERRGQELCLVLSAARHLAADLLTGIERGFLSTWRNCHFTDIGDFMAGI